MARQNFTTPVGRLVQGSTSKPQTTDQAGKPIVVKTGPNAGQPTQKYYMAVAVPKGPEQHWSQTPWGKLIWETGHAAFPNVAQRPDFAWKVADGDSTMPNKVGKKPIDQEGFRGCWVLRFSSSFAPKCYNADGSAAVPPESIKCGYFVQINGDVDGNNSPTTPGVFLNGNMVALSAFGEEIQQGPDPASAGFGQSPLPPGASATPLPGFAPAPAAPALPPAYTPPPVAAAPAYPPNPAFIAVPPVPAAPAVPVAPAAPPAAPARVMLPAAGGNSYEAMIAAGWTDDTLRQHKMMQ